MHRYRQLSRTIINSDNLRKTFPVCTIQSISSTQRRTIVLKNENEEIEDGYVKKFMKVLGLTDVLKTKLKLSGYFLYESVPNTVDYAVWFKTCELSDTFASWFIVTELHVWLLMVRTMAESEDGKVVRNAIIEALWADVGNRIKLLEGVNNSSVRKQVSELSEQFQAAIVGYDEGLDDDRVMAATIWRRFYGMSHDVKAEHIEYIVKFIRKQVMELDKTSSEYIKRKPNIVWSPISHIVA